MVLDLKSGAVVFVGDGKGADALKPFWKRLKRCRAKIEAVAMDLSPAYISAVQMHLRKAIIVFDHFHVIKLFNDKLSDLRRQVYCEAKEQLHKEVFKGTRWLLLKNPENLDGTRDEAKRLDEALRLNQPLATAYYLSEDLRRVWEESDRSAAQRGLDDWIRRAEASDIRTRVRFAHALAAHRRQSCLDCRIYGCPIPSHPYTYKVCSSPFQVRAMRYRTLSLVKAPASRTGRECRRTALHSGRSAA